MYVYNICYMTILLYFQHFKTCSLILLFTVIFKVILFFNELLVVQLFTFKIISENLGIIKEVLLIYKAAHNNYSTVN